MCECKGLLLGHLLQSIPKGGVHLLGKELGGRNRGLIVKNDTGWEAAAAFWTGATVCVFLYICWEVLAGIFSSFLFAGFCCLPEVGITLAPKKSESLNLLLISAQFFLLVLSSLNTGCRSQQGGVVLV